MFTQVYRLYMLGILLGVCMLAGCSFTSQKAQIPVKDTQFVMDTVMEITAYGPQAKPAVEAAFIEIKRIDALMNIHDINSEAARINAAAGKNPVPVSEDMLFVLSRSEQLSVLTQGVFDVTIGPLTTLWGIGKKGDFVPSHNEIAEAKALVDFRQLVIDKTNKSAYLKKTGMMIDLGSVGKGYAVDRAVAVLQQHGITSALVNAGGSIRVIGTRPDGAPWRIGVQHPRVSDGLAAKVALSPWDTLDTSGDYQRFFEKNGVRYHHILDPQTGMPAHGVTSNTIAMNNALDADILSTALAIVDIQTGINILSHFPGADALWVTETGEIQMTPGLRQKAEVPKTGR